MQRRIVLLATDRYSINMDDLYLFFSRTSHLIVAILVHSSVPRKPWWGGVFKDPARQCIVERIDTSRFPFHIWESIDDLRLLVDRIEFDFIAMGNGNGVEQKLLAEHVGREKCLFTEYGWLPWEQHFYISRNGCGKDSEIASMAPEALDAQPIDESGVQHLINHFNRGWPIFRSDFIYVPLQKDVNDFKFLSSCFQNNEAFLDFIHEIVPKDMTVLVRCHPLYKKAYNFRKYGRFIDISGKNVNKKQLYRKMKAMICINSTSILEALTFGGRVFAYGEDLFLNKALVYFRTQDKTSFESQLNQAIPTERALRFISLLLERQINRKRCISNDAHYIERHYWNTQL